MNQNIDPLCLMKEYSATQGRCLWGPRFKIWKKYLYKLFIAIHFAKANVDLDTDHGLLWHQVAVFYAVMRLLYMWQLSNGRLTRSCLGWRSERGHCRWCQIQCMKAGDTDSHWISISSDANWKARASCFCTGMAGLSRLSYSSNSRIIDIINN